MLWILRAHPMKFKLMDSIIGMGLSGGGIRCVLLLFSPVFGICRRRRISIGHIYVTGRWRKFQTHATQKMIRGFRLGLFGLYFASRRWSIWTRFITMAWLCFCEMILDHIIYLCRVLPLTFSSGQEAQLREPRFCDYDHSA